jgi:hypothetical protein
MEELEAVIDAMLGGEKNGQSCEGEEINSMRNASWR